MSDFSNCPGFSILVHGPSKAGKSWLSDTAPGPRLILDAEGGHRFTQSKKVVWNPKEAPPEVDEDTTVLVYIRDFGSLAYAYQWLAAGKHPFKSVVLDSISEIQQRCIDALVGTEALKLQDWGEVGRKVARLVRDYRDLLIHPTNPVKAVVLIAMTKQNHESGKYTPYVQGQLATSLPYFIDLVGYLQAQPDESGVMQRYLLVQPHNQYEAGDRTGVFPPILTNPNITDMLAEVCGGKE